MLLDVLWGAWLFTNVAIQLGDHFSKNARTLYEIRTGTTIEIAAETGFVITGCLLLWLA